MHKPNCYFCTKKTGKKVSMKAGKTTNKGKDSELTIFKCPRCKQTATVMPNLLRSVFGVSKGG